MNDTDRNTAIFDAVLGTTWQTMQEHSLDSCITGSRIVFDVCKEHGIRVKVVKTQVRIYNPPMTKRIQAGERPGTVEEIEQWEKEDGSWNVGIGGFGYDKPDRFDGHLVVLADKTLVLDPTLPQANRPEKGIDLAPLACTVTEGWPANGNAVGGEIRGCMVIYGAEQDDRRWVATESWQERRLRDPVLAVVREAVDSALRGV